MSSLVSVTLHYNHVPTYTLINLVYPIQRRANWRKQDLCGVKYLCLVLHIQVKGVVSIILEAYV